MREVIKQLRTENGYTIKQMAQFLSVTTSCYSNYELGYREPGIDMVRKIATTFGVSTDFLLGLENYDGTKATKVEAVRNEDPLLLELNTKFNSLSSEQKFRVLGFINGLKSQ